MALELRRATVLWTDQAAGEHELGYLRTIEKREVDFRVTRDRAPPFLVEAKTSETEVSPSLKYFQDTLGVLKVQLVNRPAIGGHVRNGAHGSSWPPRGAGCRARG